MLLLTCLGSMHSRSGGLAAPPRNVHRRNHDTCTATLTPTLASAQIWVRFWQGRLHPIAAAVVRMAKHAHVRTHRAGGRASGDCI